MNKIVEAAKEAVKVASCPHEWQQIEISIMGNFKKVVEICDKCGCRQTSWPAYLGRFR